MEKLFYSMAETADILDVPASTLRFWSDTFSRFVKPKRNAKGNRMFHPEDVEMLRQIKFLLKEKGMTMEGASRYLSDTTSGIDRTVRAVDKLRLIKEELIEVRKSL